MAEIVIAPAPPCARFSLRLRPDARDIAGFSLAVPINRATFAGKRCALHLGPDEWMLIEDGGNPAALALELETALEGRVHSLVEISDRHLGFLIEGARSRDVLNAGCPLDLCDSAFPDGTATRTLFGKAEVVLVRAAGTWRLECFRSYAPYVHALLGEAAREFGWA